jgi:glycosyltransferase involved in cell wall biosynthesis
MAAGAVDRGVGEEAGVTAIPVVHIAESTGWAGGERYLLALATELDRKRFTLSVIVPDDGPLVERLHALDIATCRVPLNARLVSPGAFLALVRTLQQLRPMIVQSHGARSNVYTRLAARYAGVPIVLSTVHNSLFDYEVAGWRRALYVGAERLTSPLADRIVSVSRAIARDLVERYRIEASRTVVVHNGIDAWAFRPARDGATVRAELRVPAGRRVVVMAGRMTPQKGWDVLLEAAARLAPLRDDIFWLLVGDGPLQPALMRRAGELGVRACFVGARADMADVLGCADLVVLASRSEGLPFTLLEAMALGKPVVATRVGGVPEVVEEGRSGRLVPPEDPAALATAVASVLDTPDAAAMGVRGRARVEAAFTLDAMVRGLERVYAAELHARAEVRA